MEEHRLLLERAEAPKARLMLVTLVIPTKPQKILIDYIQSDAIHICMDIR